MAELDIRIKKPTKVPMVAKFTDQISLEDAKLPVHMYLEDEIIEDDPEEMEKDDVVKDGAYYAALRKRRNLRFSRRQVLKLEDSTYRPEGSPPAGIIYEGSEWEPGLKHGGDGQAAPTVNYRERQVQVKDSDKPFTYALLQVIKSKDADGKAKTEVNIVPVKGFYLFKKPAVMPMKSLDLIDDDFELKMQADKAKMQRYQNLFRAKPQSSSSANEKADESDLAGGKFVLPPVFGMAMKQKVKKGLAKNANAKSFLDETGADVDEINTAEDKYQGDYESYRPNDDMAYADEGNDFAQNMDVKEAEEDVQKIEVLHEEEEEEDDDSDDEEEQGAGGSKGGGGGGGGNDEEVIKEELGLLSGVSGGKSSGLLDDRMLLEARQAGMQMAERDRKSAAAAAVAAAAEANSGGNEETSSPSSSLSGNRKRGRSSPDASEQQAGSSKKKKVYELSEDGIRDYLHVQGGPVPLDEVKAMFKSQVKAMNKQKKDSGITLITELIKRLCKTQVDPVKGKILSLK